MQLRYPVDIEEHREGPAEDQGFLVTFPDLPEAITGGDTLAEALVQASDCLEEALAGRINRREEIPLPSPAEGRPLVEPGSMIAAKAALWHTMRATGVHAAELARRIDIDRGAINRLLDPKHASRPDQLDAAFAALGKRLVLTVEDFSPAA